MLTRVNRAAASTPTFRAGLNGNYYVFASSREALVPVCRAIGKSPGSIYCNPDHRCWAIRVKKHAHKARLKQLFEGGSF